MILISHRGNIDGSKRDFENNPQYILQALSLGYDVEVDIWLQQSSEIFLGHDKPQYKISEQFLTSHANTFWCHAKNADALRFLLKNELHCFWHQEDEYTLTSKKYIWVYPNKPLLPDSICVMPERNYNGDLTKCSGICSDYILNYNQGVFSK